jgi:hypothetical protein
MQRRLIYNADGMAWLQQLLQLGCYRAFAAARLSTQHYQRHVEFV